MGKSLVNRERDPVNMATFLFLVISIFLVPGKISAVTVYYQVTASSRGYLETEVGCYAKTDLTTRAHDLKRTIYKKKFFPVRFLLQLELAKNDPSNGNWAITEDIHGNKVILEQENSNFRPTPDQEFGNWVLKRNNKMIYSLKVKAKEDCKQKDYSKVNGIYPVVRGRGVNVTDEPKENNGKEEDGKISPYVYVGFGVAGIFILVVFIYNMVLCINPPKPPTIEANPDYGKMEEYDDDSAYDQGISGVVDLNDYYDTEL